ncbi:NAD(P)-dependent dehydrogenase, short-chain alcohol dehydrogenase family [Paramicrobacterium humi]|uniref:NAD(P)-dependent dehydrogenase, short-chain alcohol dehydrogenase family n=1 Tax=Paramicrobacterium humi TaxID=640635 RepID=A0A1H4QAJ7_9MICO|nr:glucose 1-dehydrogenase [Microbacterium humi]SEC16676.1 NAD(P)-dependent dehydrogenase, short-chain alcohol dehydrogenase family [Microbacterium humi]
MSASSPLPAAPTIAPRSRFQGRSALVTGAANGIGAAIAEQLVAEGARVTGVDIDADGLRERERTLGAENFVGIVADLAAPETFADLVAAASREGSLDVLVNNAGVFLMGGVHATAEQWQRTLDVNVVGPAKLVQAAIPALTAASRAAIVNIASISGHVGQPERWTYNAGKGATLAMTRCQALDLAPHGIRVNSVSPGYVWTDVLEASSGGDRETWDPIWGSSCPMLRCGEPREVAMAVAFLASDDASYITGTDLLVDGGSLSMAPDALAGHQFAK